MGVSSEMRVSLELARELNGLKQSEAAQKIGVSTDTLGNYERGKSYPDIPILRKMPVFFFIFHSSFYIRLVSYPSAS